MTASQFSPTPGEAKNSWLTGTGAWSLVTAQQYILGVQVTYTIKVRNPKGKTKGVKSVIVDGQKLSGNVVPLATDGRTAVNVEVTLGA
jgi:cellobiose phosphorylase